MNPVNGDLFGVLNLSKPAGVTSRDVVNRIQRLVKPAKVGHAGTLDPMATGVLLVCVGPATRLVSVLQECRKIYVAEFTLGQTSDTDDSTGIVQQHTVEHPPSAEAIVQCLQTMTGTISQVPPDFSAVHVNGQRAYSLARQGESVVLSAKQIEIHSIRVLSCEWPRIVLEIQCGSGTYVRSVARDLGRQLGCGGLMSALVRTAVGPFSLTDSIDPEQLTAETVAQHVCPAIRIVESLPKHACSARELGDLLCGRRLKSFTSTDTAEHGNLVALTDGDGLNLLALAEKTPDGWLQPRTVFVKP